MRFGILWALAVWRNGEPVEVGGPRVRMLLALLLLDAGRTVSPARLIVELASGGYRPAVAPEAVDAQRFELLVAEGRRALASGDPHLAADRLRVGLALWR